MAVSEQTPYIEYTANGTTTSFALEFDCENQDHLIVLVDDVEPVVGTWALNNGAVVFGTAPENGKKITIQRNTPFSRTTDYQSYNNSFRPPAVNKDFDWIWLKLQELGVADWILSNRISALKAYVDDRDDELRAYLMEEIRKQGVALDQLDDYYNYLMQRLAQIAVQGGWEASFVVDASGLNQQEWNSGVESIADLLAIPNPKNGSRVYVKSYYNGLNKGGGVRIYVSSRNSENDGFLCINGWVLQVLNGAITPDHAGAKANDSSFDSTSAINKALSSGYALCGNSFDTYYVSDNIVSKGQEIFGGFKISSSKKVRPDFTNPIGLVSTTSSNVPEPSNIKFCFVCVFCQCVLVNQSPHPPKSPDHHRADL